MSLSDSSKVTIAQSKTWSKIDHPENIPHGEPYPNGYEKEAR
jgi:hypothetical protein